MTEEEAILGYELAGWVHYAIGMRMLGANVDFLEAYAQLLDEGLDIDNMWAIEAAMHESWSATIH